MLQITFRHMTSSESLCAVAQEKFEKLGRHFNESVHCHLVIDCCPGHVYKGDQFTAHVELTLGAADLRVDASAKHEQAATAVRRAFDHVERQLMSRYGRGTVPAIANRHAALRPLTTRELSVPPAHR